jgi:hypothetical protein
MAVGPGRKERWIAARRFIFHCQHQIKIEDNIKTFQCILFAEDDPKDVELTADVTYPEGLSRKKERATFALNRGVAISSEIMMG